MPRFLRRTFIGLLALAAVGVCGLAASIAVGVGTPPPPLESIYDPFRRVDFMDLPPLETMRARDGTALAYRTWPAAGPQKPDHVVVAIHGSSAHSQSLHPLGKALQAEGITMIAPDLRGHGGSGRRGDIDYRHQLDDDFADFTAFVRKRFPGATLSLLGFSSGGGFALREAATPSGGVFERAVLVAPMLGVRTPTVKDSVSAWVKVDLPRIIGLTILDRLRIRAFEGLPVLAFAIAPGNPGNLTPVYSFRLMTAFGTIDYAADLRNAQPKLTVLVGEKDELFYADRFAATVNAVRPDAQVKVVPELNHIEMTTDPRATTAIVAAIKSER